MPQDKKGILAEFKRATDAIDEIAFLNIILRYAQAGHGTPLIVEQAIALVDRTAAYFKESGDAATYESAMGIKAGLQQALVDGVGSLRVKRGPGPEVTEVEEPLAHFRISVGHKIQRQRKCGGGIVDIFDVSANQLIECKHRGTSAALGEAAGQLHRYRKSFPDAELCIAVLAIEPEAEWMADVLRSQGIRIFEVGKG